MSPQETIDYIASQQRRNAAYYEFAGAMTAWAASQPVETVRFVGDQLKRLNAALEAAKGPAEPIAQA